IIAAGTVLAGVSQKTARSVMGVTAGATLNGSIFGLAASRMNALAEVQLAWNGETQRKIRTQIIAAAEFYALGRVNNNATLVMQASSVLETYSIAYRYTRASFTPAANLVAVSYRVAETPAERTLTGSGRITVLNSNGIDSGMTGPISTKRRI
ncbi:MAG TPA: hypothetical protein VKB96_02600, partial [Gammaproteobacteria bacterium]|nr:hypothetical protein [Gammaproteobacteria bacterium]